MTPAAGRAPRAWAVRRLGGVPLLLILIVVVLYPIGCLLVQMVFPQAFAVHTNWGLSLDTVRRTLANPLNVASVRNSFAIGLLASLLATLLGLVTAFGAHRAPRAWAALITASTWTVFFAPSYVIAQGWLVFMQNGGVASQLFHLANGWSAWYFSDLGLVLTMGLRYFPFVHFAVAPALEAAGGEYESAARLFGANRWRTLTRITLPLLVPAIFAGASIAFAEGFGDFGFAAAITPQTHIPLLAYQIYALLSQAPIDYASAAGLSFVLLLVTGLVLAMQLGLMRGRSFATTTMHSRPHRDGEGRMSAGTFAGVAVVGLALIIPLGSVMAVSLWKDWGYGIAWTNWTLHNYAAAFQVGTAAWQPLIRSLSYAGVAGFATMALALYAGYQVTFHRSPVSQFVNVVTMAAVAVPGVVIAAGFIFAWNAVWLIPVHLILYGTAVCLAMAYVAGMLPYAIRLQHGAMSQISHGFVVAGRLAGARTLRVLRRIVLPLVLSTAVTTFFMALTSTMFELPASMLLYPAGAPPFPVTIEMQFNDFHWAAGSALTIIGMALVMGLYLLGQRLVGWTQEQVEGAAPQAAPAQDPGVRYGLAGIED